VTNVVDLKDTKICDCPKCGMRTFLVYEHKRAVQEKGKRFETNVKGQCLNCGFINQFIV
jgi:RNase P subunit RPR2